MASHAGKRARAGRRRGAFVVSPPDAATLDVKARRAPVAEALKNARLTPEDIVDRLTLTPLGDENSASE